MSVISDISGFIGKQASGLKDGVKSGLNKKTMGEIAGIQSLRKAPGRLRDARYNIEDAYLDRTHLNEFGARMNAMDTAVQEGLEIADNMLGYFGARDYADKGLAKRFGVGTARTLGSATAVGLGTSLAVNTADFFNPFGFGSIAD